MGKNDGRLNLEHLPFPVAYLLAYARDESVWEAYRVRNAINAAFQSVKMTALLLLSDYQRGASSSANISGVLHRLEIPHWGDWSALCDALAEFFCASESSMQPPGAQPVPSTATRGHFGKLATRWRQVNAKTLPVQHTNLLQGLPNVPQSLNAAVWKLRNDLAHSAAVQIGPDPMDKKRLDSYLPIVERMIADLFSDIDFAIVRPGIRPGSMIRLQGDHHHGLEGSPVFEEEQAPSLTSAAFETSSVVALVGGEAVPLRPLFVLPRTLAEDGIYNGGLVEPLLLLEKADKGCAWLELKGVVRGTTEKSAEHARDFQALYKVPPLLERAATRHSRIVDPSRKCASESLEEIRGTKYFADSYVRRSEVDDSLERWFETPNRALLVLGEAGAGKSSLLARLVETLLNRSDPEPILYLANGSDYRIGHSAGTGDRALCAAICAKAGVEPSSFKKLGGLLDALASNADGHRLWIVMDGIDEADGQFELLRSFDKLLPLVNAYPWLKLVASMRSGTVRAATNRDSRSLSQRLWLTNSEHLMSFEDELSHRRNESAAQGRTASTAPEALPPHLHVRRFTASETELAYEWRQKDRGRPSCPISYRKVPESWRTELRDPFYLDIFHREFAGKTALPPGQPPSRLASLYVESCVQESRGGLVEYLTRIGQHMYETRSSDISRQFAIDEVANWERGVGRLHLSPALLDPFEHLVSDSILRKNVTTGGFVFRHQRLAEAVLRRHLAQVHAPRGSPNRKELRAWCEYAGPAREADDGELGEMFGELLAVLEGLAAELAVAGHADVLCGLLELSESEAAFRVLGSALVVAADDAIGASGASGPASRTIRELSLAAGRDEHAAWPFLHAVTLACTRDPTRVRRTELLCRRGCEAALAAIKACRPSAEFQEAYQEILNRLVGALIDGGHIEEARELCEESLVLARRQMWRRRDDADNQRRFDLALGRLAEIRERQGRDEEALALHEEGLAGGRRRLGAVAGTDDAREALGVKLDNLAEHLSVRGKQDRAISLQKEALAIARGLLRNNRHSLEYTRDVQSALSKLASYSEDVGYVDDARAYRDEAKEIGLSVDRDREDRGSDIVALEDARSLERVGNHREAREEYERQVEARRHRLVQDPDNQQFRFDLHVALDDLGRSCEGSRHFKRLRDIRLEDLNLCREIASIDPTDLEGVDRLADVLEKWAALQGAKAELAAALEEATVLRRGLARKRPTNLHNLDALGWNCSNMARLCETNGKVREAKSLHEEAVSIHRRLVAASPREEVFTESLSSSLAELCDMLAASNGKAEQAAALSVALERVTILENWVARLGGGKPSMISDLKRAKRTLTRLQRMAKPTASARGKKSPARAGR